MGLFSLFVKVNVSFNLLLKPQNMLQLQPTRWIVQSLRVFVLLVDKSGEWRTLFETAVASTYANTTLVFLHSVLQCATTPFILCSVLSTLVSVHDSALPSYGVQCCCVAYYQDVQCNHTCSANNKILLFQSPCTGTRQCGQVISTSSVQIFISSKKWRQLWKTNSLLVFQTLLWLLLTRQGMGASQSSVCQVRKKTLTQSHQIVVHCHAIFIWWFFVVKVETEACGPLARVGAGLGSSLTSTLDLVQVFWSYLYFLYLYLYFLHLYLSFSYFYSYFFFGSV